MTHPVSQATRPRRTVAERVAMIRRSPAAAHLRRLVAFLRDAAAIIVFLAVLGFSPAVPQ